MLSSVHNLTGIGEWVGGGQDAILVYHAVGDSTSAELFGQISVERFSADLSNLIEKYEIVPLEELLVPSDSPRVALTFDDGLASVHSTVLPLLREFEAPATVFVTPGFIDDRNREMLLRKHGIDSDNRIILTEAEVFDLVDDPLVTIGNHSLTHTNLSAVCSPEKLHREIVESRNQLEDRFGIDVTAFSYPYGAVNEPAKELVESTHDISVTTKPYLLMSPTSGHQLPRIPGHVSPKQLSWELTPLSDHVNTIRYR